MTPIEEKIRAVHASGDIALAANIAIETYGREVFGFIMNCTHRSSECDDIFSAFRLNLWKGLPGFKWRSSMRTWAYTLARNATVKHLANPALSATRRISLTDAPEVFEVADRVRTTTAAYLKTTKKESLRRIRKQLPVTDQMLLVLRIDRTLPWRDIAMVMEGEHLAGCEDELTTAVGRYRKRFERIKEKLREIASEKGLL